MFGTSVQSLSCGISSAALSLAVGTPGRQLPPQCASTSLRHCSAERGRAPAKLQPRLVLFQGGMCTLVPTGKGAPQAS